MISKWKYPLGHNIPSKTTEMRPKMLYLLYPVDVLHIYIYLFPQKFPTRFSHSSPWKTSVKQAKMRDELMKKFAEDDRLEQVSEHKRRMKACQRRWRHGGLVKAVKRWGVHREEWGKEGMSLGKTGDMGFDWQIRNFLMVLAWWPADRLVFRWRNSVWGNVCFDFGCLNSHKSWWRHVTSVLLY